MAPGRLCFMRLAALLVTSSDTKRDNRIYRIDASRRVSEPDVSLNPSYTRWLHHQPSRVIPSQIAADAGLIKNRRTYNSWKNISHITTLPVPYYTNSEEYGLGMLALFSEPLSKHMINLAASVSFTNPRDNSLLFLSYTNNQFRPSISLNFYHNSFTGRFYERDYLVTTNSGIFLMASLPRDWFDNQFISTRLYTRIRSEYTDATRFWEEGSSDQSLGTPDNGRQDDLRLGMLISKQKPYAHQMIHPLSGWGVEARISMATDAIGGETSYVRPDLTSYIILPGLGNQRFYLYGRAVAQWGEAFAQDYIGLSRYDDIQFGGTLAGLDFLYTDTERIRGYREYVTGNRLLFGSVEYRIPFADDLNTSLLGLISLGRTTLTAFADGGLVWSDDMSPGSEAVRRAGAGLELKNVLNIAGINIVHSLGVAQPVEHLGKDKHAELYYRIRAVVPF
jgi:outer membrane protein assembly factor BamA